MTLHQFGFVLELLGFVLICVAVLEARRRMNNGITNENLNGNWDPNRGRNER